MSIETTAAKMKLDGAISEFEKATSELTGDQAVLAEATKNALKVFESEILNIVKHLR